MLKKIDSMEEIIKSSLLKTHNLLNKLLESDTYISSIKDSSKIIIDAISRNNSVFLAGNGGSAAHSQHFAAEFVSRFNFERSPLPAYALSTDSSILTAVSNDYGYEKVFERQLSALARPGDVFIGFSTSGKSINIINAFKKANELDLFSIGICGKQGIKGANLNVEVSIPSENTPLIQEMHGITSHLICDIVEKSIFKK